MRVLVYDSTTIFMDLSRTITGKNIRALVTVHKDEMLNIKIKDKYEKFTAEELMQACDELPEEDKYKIMIRFSDLSTGESADWYLNNIGDKMTALIGRKNL